MKNESLWYGHDAQEVLDSDPDDTVITMLEDCKPGETFDDVDNRIEWPFKVLEYRTKTIDPDGLVNSILEPLLESLDEEYNAQDEYTDITPGMKEAALVFAKTIVDEYKVWACEATGNVIEYTKEDARKLFADESDVKDE